MARSPVVERARIAWTEVSRHAYTWPSRILSRYNGDFVTRIETDGASASAPTMYLTFDDGPTRVHTDALLDLLREHGARASFFLIAEDAERHAATIRRTIDEGHTVGVHGYTHADPWFSRASTVRADLGNALGTLRDAFGVDARWIRPAYGHVRPTTFRFSVEHGLRIAGWDLMPGDFAPGIDARLVFRRIASGVRNGSIVVLHDNDVVADTGVVLEALGLVLRYFGDRGWRFEPLPDR